MGASDLPLALRRSGFVRLSPALFADEPVADPAAAWRAGFDLAEVHTGYAVERTDNGQPSSGDGESGDGTSVTARLLDRLRAGADCVVVGPPGRTRTRSSRRSTDWPTATTWPCCWTRGRRSGTTPPSNPPWSTWQW